VALVLCTGVDEILILTRKMILESAGHKVIPTTGQIELIRACEENQFDVAVIGQVITKPEKQRILSLIREHCPDARMLELFTPSTGSWLPDADDWLEVPRQIPSELVERVSLLAR
jgi:hypothetical protein